MQISTVVWLVLGGIVAGFEAWTLIEDHLRAKTLGQQNPTLSATLWRFLGIGAGHNRGYRWRRAAFLAFWIWFAVHIITGGWT